MRDVRLPRRYKLSYSTYPVDFHATVDGSTVVANSDSGSAFTTFTEDTSALSGGVGTITVTSTEGDITLTRAYTMASAASYSMTATITIANGGSADVTGEAWMGTRDDYVGSSDSPTKTIGSLTASGFSNTGANTVEIKSGDEVVYVTSPDTGSQGLIDSSFSPSSFSGIYEQTTSALPSSQSDGGYGVYVNFGTIPAGGEVSRQIIYAAGAVDVIAQVAQAASEGGPVVEEEAVPEAVETAIATAVAATVTTSVATSVGASVGSVRAPIPHLAHLSYACMHACIPMHTQTAIMANRHPTHEMTSEFAHARRHIPRLHATSPRVRPPRSLLARRSVHLSVARSAAPPRARARVARQPASPVRSCSSARCASCRC